MNLGLVENEFFSVTNRQHTQKINKWALKLIGLSNINLSHEDLLEFISLHVHASSIQALVYDTFHDFYTLFLNNIESFCQLVGRKASTGSYSIRFLPLLDFYVVDNVYPSTTNDDLSDTFGNFGHVFQVTNYQILPNSSKFSHVLSGKREISFTLPGEKTELFIPVNVLHHPYKYQVKKLCSACVTEGHSVLDCPDIEDDVKSEQNEVDCSSDSELGCILKTEDLPLFDSEKFPCLEYKEETEKDPICDFESMVNTSSIITSVEERDIVPYSNGSNASSNVISSVPETPLVPLNNEKIQLDLHISEICTKPLQLSDKSQPVSEEGFEQGFISSEFHTGPSQLCDKATLVSEMVIEHDLHSSEFPNGYQQLSDKSPPVLEKIIEQDLHSAEFPIGHQQLCVKTPPASEKIIEPDLQSSEFSTRHLRLADKSQQTPEISTSKILPITSNPENTSTAVTCNSSSHFFKEFLHKRKSKKRTSITPNNEKSKKIKEKSRAVGNKLLKKTCHCADISKTETKESSYLSLTRPKVPRKVSWQLSPDEEKYISKSAGVLPPQVLKEVILSDGRNPSFLLRYICTHTTNLKLVDSQFKRLYRRYRKSYEFKRRPCRAMLSKIIRIRRLFKFQ